MWPHWCPQYPSHPHSCSPPDRLSWTPADGSPQSLDCCCTQILKEAGRKQTVRGREAQIREKYLYLLFLSCCQGHVAFLHTCAWKYTRMQEISIRLTSHGGSCFHNILPSKSFINFFHLILLFVPILTQKMQVSMPQP